MIARDNFTKAFLAALASLLVLPALASAGNVSGTNTFTGLSMVDSSDWNDPSNWSQNEIPDGADDVVIPSGKTVNLSSGPSGTAQTLSLGGSLKVDGGSVPGGRSLTIVGTTNLATGVLNVWNGAVLNLGTTTNWDGSTVGVGGGGGGTINIGASSVLNITGNVSSSNYAGGLWNNQGTINRTTATGTASINNAVENDGAINVNSGTLALQNGDGSGSSSGDYTAAAGTTLKFLGSSNELTSGASLGGAGTVVDNGATLAIGAGVTFNPGALSLDGAGTLQLDSAGTTGSLTATGGTRSGSGTLTVSGAANLSGTDVFVGTGTTTLAGTTNISVTNFNVRDGHTLELGPTTVWSAGAVGVGGIGGATVDIGVGDVLNITGDAYSGNFSDGLWHNEGTINRTTSVGTATFNTPVENDGAINVSSGVLSLQYGDGAGTSSGSYAANGPGTLNFGGGMHDLTAASTVTGTGTVRFGSGTATVAAGATFNPAMLSFLGGELKLDTSGTTGSLDATQGTRSGSGTLEVTGAMHVSQYLSLDGSGTTTVDGTTTLDGTALYVQNGHALNLGTTTNWSGGIVNFGGSGDATVNLSPGDVLNISANVNAQGSGGTWNNQGTINRTTSSGAVDFFVPVTSSGTINVHSGTLAFDLGLTQTAGLTAIDAGTTLGGAVALQGGTLKGAGTASGNVTNTGGTVAPGFSPGKLAIGGNYTQSAGTLQAEIAGTGQGASYDWLAVAGSVTINGGTLAIVNDPQFAPAMSDSFDVVTAGATVAGTGFASVTGAQLSGKSYGVQTVTGPPGKVVLALQSGPSNGVPPSVPLTAHSGDVVHCDPGTWSGSPTSFEYQWLREGSPIAGATAADYTVTPADVGESVTCRVTATNAAGSSSTSSNALMPMPAAPSNASSPSVASSATEGDTLTCDPGTWNGSPTSFSFEWLRNGTPILGAISDGYTLAAADVGTSIVCRVTATNAGGNSSASSNAVVPSGPPSPPPPPSTAVPPASSSSHPATPAAAPSAPANPEGETVRGDLAFTQGTANDLYLACTKLDLLLIDVLPAGSRTVSVTGAADLRLAGQTAEILLDGKRVATAAIRPDGSFAAKVRAPQANRRKNARYQARVGATVSQKLKLERRMIATTLTRSGSNLVLRGKITKPFARKPAAIAIERYLSCRRHENVRVATVVPDRNGNFAVAIPLPANAAAVIYRALTRVPPRPSAAATARTFTLPRAIDL